MGADAAWPRPGRRRGGLEPARLGTADGQVAARPAFADQSRLHQTADFGPPVDEERLYRIVDALDAVAEETGKTVPQIAINWLLRRPTVASVIIGARNEAQLRDNLGAVGWALTPAQIAALDAASAVTAAYPYFPYQRQGGFARLSPPAV